MSADPQQSPPVVVEEATEADWPVIGALTAGVYTSEGHATERYARVLADVAGRATQAQLLVARDAAGAVVGSVAMVLDGEFGEVLEAPDEAGFRMLVVDPAARGQGIGELLVRTCLERARAAGKRRVVISSDLTMTAAHRLYERTGFRRLPERDWAPWPGVDLVVYVREV